MPKGDDVVAERRASDEKATPPHLNAQKTPVLRADSLALEDGGIPSSVRTKKRRKKLHNGQNDFARALAGILALRGGAVPDGSRIGSKSLSSGFRTSHCILAPL
jgi:hypothetical protein